MSLESQLEILNKNLEALTAALQASPVASRPTPPADRLETKTETKPEQADKPEEKASKAKKPARPKAKDKVEPKQESESETEETPVVVTMDDVRKACVTTSAISKEAKEAVKDLLTQYGAKKLSDLDKDRYAEFVAELHDL